MAILNVFSIINYPENKPASNNLHIPEITNCQLYKIVSSNVSVITHRSLPRKYAAHAAALKGPLPETARSSVGCLQSTSPRANMQSHVPLDSQPLNKQQIHAFTPLCTNHSFFPLWPNNENHLLTTKPKCVYGTVTVYTLTTVHSEAQWLVCLSGYIPALAVGVSRRCPPGYVSMSVASEQYDPGTMALDYDPS